LSTENILLDVATSSEDDLPELIEKLRVLLPSNSKVLMRGVVGAGKTTLVRHLLSSLDYHGRFQSPTFTLVNEYAAFESDVPVLRHLDLYRLGSWEECVNLGIEELLQDDVLTLVEWGELFPEACPFFTHELSIDFENHGRRYILKKCL
jgi:tRNA threonylcarbamoyladenosine biosynthesis protein TsaE